MIGTTAPAAIRECFSPPHRDGRGKFLQRICPIFCSVSGIRYLYYELLKPNEPTRKIATIRAEVHRNSLRYLPYFTFHRAIIICLVRWHIVSNSAQQ